MSISLKFLLILLVFSSWCFGGREAWVENTIIISIWCYLLFFLLMRWKEVRGSKDTFFIKVSGGKAAFIFFLIFAGFELIRCLNPMYEQIVLMGERKLLFQKDFVRFLPATVLPADTFQRSMLIIGLFGGCLSFLWTRFTRREIRILLWGLVINGVAMAIVGSLIEFSGSTQLLGLFPSVNTRFFGAFYYANHYCAWQVLNICAALSLAYLYSKIKFENPERRKELQLLLSVFVALMLLSLPLSGSRSGTLLMLLVCLGLTSMFIWRFLKPSRSNRKKNGAFSKKVGVVTATLFLSILSVVSMFWFSWGSIGGRIEQSQKELQQIASGDGGHSHRYLHFRDTFRVFKAKPVLGWGVDSYKHVLPLYAGPEWGARLGSARSGLDAAHTDLLQYLAEWGIVSFILIHLSAFFLLRITLSAHSKTILFLLWGIALVFFMASFEFPLRNPAVMTSVAIIAKLSLHLASKRFTPR